MNNEEQMNENEQCLKNNGSAYQYAIRCIV